MILTCLTLSTWILTGLNTKFFVLPDQGPRDACQDMFETVRHRDEATSRWLCSAVTRRFQGRSRNWIGLTASIQEYMYLRLLRVRVSITDIHEKFLANDWFCIMTGDKGIHTTPLLTLTKQFLAFNISLVIQYKAIYTRWVHLMRVCLYDEVWSQTQLRREWDARVNGVAGHSRRPGGILVEHQWPSQRGRSNWLVMPSRLP